jgi:hypothetical protein
LGKRASGTHLQGGWLRPSASVGGKGNFCPSRISLHELTTPVILKKTVITYIVYYISEVPPFKHFEPGCVECGMLIMSSGTIFNFQISAINNTNKSIAQDYDVGVTNDRSLYGLNLCDGLWKWNILVITNQAEVFGFIPITVEFLQFYLFIT